ncbi:GrpB family protein [Bosea sp. 2KB_26]|uniref:GrpB family protein n=1 Tax=Bosea sp. 2KB_26 TaxID=3237475 RepID=UPI003F8F0888
MQLDKEIIVFEEGDPNENPWVSGSPTIENIVVEKYSPLWVQEFNKQQKNIETALADFSVKIEHVGSTAVPGLPAKPVIDIDLIVEDPSRETDYVPTLSRIGYKLTIREPSWYQHRMLRLAEPRVNLHVFGRNCPEHIRHVLFRDWLRAHPDDRQRYADAKSIAADGVDTANAYNMNKQSVVRDIYQTIFRARGLI